MIYQRMSAAIIAAFLCVSSLHNHHGASAWVQDRRFNIPQNRKRASQPRNNLVMDVEAPTGIVTMPHGFSFGSSFKKLCSVPQTTYPSRHRTSSGRSQHKANDLDESIVKAATSHGMPWRTSIDPTYTRDSLYFMKFWEWQIHFMKQHLTNLRVLPVESRISGRDLSYAENKERGMRIHTVQFASDEYKLIRMTVVDGGKKLQVFTSLWYPQPSYNLPVLGIDLLQFNQKKHLCVVDFQPIQEKESLHAQPYEHVMKPIRDLYPSLQGSMTDRFFDADFFSKQMLLARPDGCIEADKVIQRELFPAFCSYLKTHVDLVHSTPPAPSKQIPTIIERHAAFDEYAATQDPAHALLAKAFGQEFSDDYVYDILFPLSRRQT